MNALQFAEYLKSINACDPACKWQEGKDLETVWNTCERGDWMIWLLVNSENEVTDRELRLIAVKCARQVQHLMKDERSINALDVAERFANGEATQEELNAAGDAARAAGEAAGDAAWAAAWEAWERVWRWRRGGGSPTMCRPARLKWFKSKD